MPMRWIKLFFWIFLLFVIGVGATVINPADPDLWHRLAVGEFLWQKGRFPNGDDFSYLADYRFIADHEWGSALIFYALWQMGGGVAMVLTKLVTVTATMVLVVNAATFNRRPTAPLAAFYALVFLAVLPSFQSTVRCMIFTHLFFALWIFWYQRERFGKPVATALYAVTMIAWANLHGGFAVGLAWLLLLTVLGIWFGHDWRKWALRLLLCALATLVNPYGWHLWFATARALVTTRQGFQEWAPVSWTSDLMLYPGYKLLVIFALVAVGVQLVRRGWARLDRPAVILILVFLLLATSSARHTSLFAVVAGALLPGIFPLKFPYDVSRRPLRRLAVLALNYALILVPVFSGLLVIPQGRGLQLDYPPIACPVGAVDYLARQRVSGNLLVPFNYGSYALWELRGHMRVSLDGRYDLVYKPETYRRVEEFFAGKSDWPKLLTTPAPDAILVPRSADVYYRLHDNPRWKEAFRDSVDAVFLPL